MKKYRYLMLFLLSCLGYVGCEENEIALYDESPRINLLWSGRSHTFRDTHYVKGLEYEEMRIEVELQGYLLQAPRDFVVKAQAGQAYGKQAGVVLPTKYTYTALDTSKQWIVFKVKRPDKPTLPRTPEGAILKFDLENPAHQFAPGRKDMDSCRIEVFYNLAPTSATWNSSRWGIYSIAKYFFMMDYFKAVYKDMKADRLGELKEAYAAYKAEHGPILDDKGEEITFPN